MKYVLKYRREAETDLEKTKAYYTDISQFLAEKFFVELFETISFIKESRIYFK